MRKKKEVIADEREKGSKEKIDTVLIFSKM